MNHIKQIRINAGFNTSKEAAKALKISNSMMSSLECGCKRPSIDLAFVMRNILKCTLDEIYLPYNYTESEVS